MQMLKVNNLPVSSDSSVSLGSHDPTIQEQDPGSCLQRASDSRLPSPCHCCRLSLHPLSLRHLLCPGHLGEKAQRPAVAPWRPPSLKPRTPSLMFYAPASFPVAALLVLPDWKAPAPEICTEIHAQTVLSKTAPAVFSLLLCTTSSEHRTVRDRPLRLSQCPYASHFYRTFIIHYNIHDAATYTITIFHR